MTLVVTTQYESVMTITLADELRRNALSRQLMSELLDAVTVADSDPTVRVVVLTNQGTVFCAGADLGERERGSSASPVELSELFQRIRSSPKPFVGRVRGHCIAGGVGLAAVLDISVALDTAQFGFSEVRVGVAPAIISVVCLPKMRAGDARSAFLRGNRFSGSEAVRLGLINEAVSAQEIDDRVRLVVNDLLAGEPAAIAAAKQLTMTVPAMAVDEAFAWTRELSATLFASDPAREGMAAFREKRPASWVRRLDDD